MKLNLAEEFSPFPYGRDKTDGNFCGEIFRDEYLIPAFRKARDANEALEVSLEGVQAGPSFLEEAFGGMVRQLIRDSISFEDIQKTVILVGKSPDNVFIKKINQFMEAASKI